MLLYLSNKHEKRFVPILKRFIFKHDIETGKYFDSKKTKERGRHKAKHGEKILSRTFILILYSNRGIERLNTEEGESTESGILLAYDSRNLSTGIEENAAVCVQLSHRSQQNTECPASRKYSEISNSRLPDANRARQSGGYCHILDVGAPPSQICEYSRNQCSSVIFGNFVDFCFYLPVIYNIE